MPRFSKTSGLAAVVVCLAGLLIPAAAGSVTTQTCAAPMLHAGISLPSDDDLSNAVFRYDSTTQFSTETGNLLTHGNLLVAAKSDTTIHADCYHVIVPNGTIALLSNNDGVVKVRNLCERRRRSLLVQVSKKHLPVASGEELVLSRSFDALRQAVATDMVPRRRVSLFDLSCGGSVLSSEIWTPAVMARSSILRAMRQSKKKCDRKLSEDILKMAVCLAYATGTHGGFRYVAD